ncbi:MAG: hypothetical protein Q7O66_07265 [Dehalococcoidia bacterium]|nr:hypothetical protein [Dehalococcoidia bacterium]
MTNSPGSGRTNAPRDAAGHFVQNPTEEPDEIQELETEDPFLLIEHPRKHAMLMTYCLVGKVHESAARAGISWVSHYYWLQKDPQYAEAWKLAQEIHAVELEDEVTRRGKDGVDLDVRDKNGNIVGTRKQYSDLLLIFRTKAQWPGKYGDRVTMDIETRVREVAQALGADPDEAVEEARRLTGPGGRRLLGPGR